jgi:hypothetical protein
MNLVGCGLIDTLVEACSFGVETSREDMVNFAYYHDGFDFYDITDECDYDIEIAYEIESDDIIVTVATCDSEYSAYEYFEDRFEDLEDICSSKMTVNSENGSEGIFSNSNHYYVVMRYYNIYVYATGPDEETLTPVLEELRIYQ